MKKWLAAATLFIPLALAGCSHPQPVYYQPPPPPLPLREIAQQGFQDGYDAARHDIAYGRPLALERHKLFHHPPVPRPAFGDYRDGFRRGYDAFINRNWGPRPGY